MGRLAALVLLVKNLFYKKKQCEFIMKQLITKPVFMFVLFAAVLNLTGCASVFLSTFNLQQVTIVADDDDAYDFYVNGNLKCENTNVCDIHRSTVSRCKMTIEAVRDGVVLGTEKYGYWEEPSFIEQMFRDDDDDEKEKKCPAGLFSGAQAVVKIDQEIKARVSAAREKAWTGKNNASWETSPLSPNSAE